MNTIKRHSIYASYALGIALFWSGQTLAATISLFDFGINVDGATTCNVGPCGVQDVLNLSSVAGLDDSGFDYTTGLGTLELTLNGVGAHSVDLFLDHEIDEPINTFFNEYGMGGTAVAGQSWEIDEPGALFGDIFIWRHL